ncbi:uncharacterized protein SPAPADRAFT_134238 [Spathaspora passalidarum NRRL Y-27907]|uniref:Uncharacterized protein n=1 Tax=Spathaspora passalidarum (strain NRRL Y-27907 / 11-Y1) TaxID=619300 RepID=G3AHS3_SPAPN|nr:uncharacterized protein SPAPADRAFT_134238 [Spathaspora passalidarum NRRL Y-27907]EGW34237.1 hypothetical protein SPAPADRAFT_134238 [Spathaspora passalidarum NRRL Y-27907]
MNISENERKLLNNTDVYNACNGEYYKGRAVNREFLKTSTTHKLITGEKGLKLVIDKDADDVDMVYTSRGTAIPPDELLDMMKPDDLKIPIKHREDFKSGGLPDSELLKSIHYFVSRRLTKNEKSAKKYARRMDETALMAMGILVESWVDRLLDKDTCRLFLADPEEEEESDEENENSEDNESTSSTSSSEDE